MNGPIPLVLVPDALREMGERLRTQDNRVTSHPLFLVQERSHLEPAGDPVDLWDFSDACFTEAGAEAVIARHRHNLRDPRIYVASGFRNAEWQAVRAFLMSLPPLDKADDAASDARAVDECFAKVRTMVIERDRLREINAALLAALKRSHSCATVRDDGTCEGCFVSEAIKLAEKD